MSEVIYPSPESKVLEFKEYLPKLQTIIKTCIAFANTSGGQIIIGVEDNNREVCGIREEDRDRIYESLPNSLYDSVSPPLVAHIYEKNIQNHLVMVLEIPLGNQKPYFLKSEGIPEGVYVRVGAHTRRATPEIVGDIQREGRRKYFDEESQELTLDDLSKHLLQQVYGKQYAMARLLNDRVITTSSWNPETYLATHTGLLFFNETPHHYIPEALIRCTHFQQKDTRNIIQTQDITGPLGRQIDDALVWLQQFTLKELALEGAQMKPQTSIPLEALREAIVNAVIHRKYSVPGAIKIAVSPNQIEIFSPGCFPGLVSLQNLGDGTTYLRNPHLAKVARQLGYIESLGSGIRLIFDSCKQAQLPAPKFYEDGDFVKVTFSLIASPTAKALPDEEDLQRIYTYTSKHQPVSVSDVMELLKVSRNTATRKLNRLIQQGVLLRHGRGPSTHFVLKHNHSE